MSTMRPASPHYLDSVPRAAAVAALAAIAALVALVAGCGDGAPEERTVAADRTSGETETRRELPPPTPDYRADTAGPGTTAGDTVGEPTEPPSPDTIALGDAYERAETAYRAGDHRRALRLFEAHLEREPDHTWARYLLGLAARKADRPDRAVRAFRTVLEEDPDHAGTRVNLARTLLDSDRPAEALETLRPVLRGPRPPADALRVAGNAALTTGDRDRAERLYRAAVSTDGSDAWSMNNLGLLLIRRGQYREALGPLARAAELRPERAELRNNLAAALERTGRPGLAAEHYRAAAAAGHPKAGASLARVEPRASDGGDPELDLEEVAHDFAVRAERWRPELALEPTAPSPPPPADSASAGPTHRF